MGHPFQIFLLQIAENFPGKKLPFFCPYMTFPGIRMATGRFIFDLWRAAVGRLSGLWRWRRRRCRRRRSVDCRLRGRRRIASRRKESDVRDAPADPEGVGRVASVENGKAALLWLVVGHHGITARTHSQQTWRVYCSWAGLSTRSDVFRASAPRQLWCFFHGRHGICFHSFIALITLNWLWFSA